MAKKQQTSDYNKLSRKDNPLSPKFKTKFYYTPDSGQKNTLPSMTIPDESFTIRELLENHTLMPEQQRRVIYSEDNPEDDDISNQDPDYDLIDQGKRSKKAQKIIDQAAIEEAAKIEKETSEHYRKKHIDEKKTLEKEEKKKLESKAKETPKDDKNEGLLEE